ncbi:DnaJ domain family protein [Babesia bovis T2Bo]|uniref:DnaJ domain family protein n=1 Tax=Babesia bovis T2Bo TaxID=484906 RepID=UPI001C36A43F|nr:DnaJ domain family protein [Babesia bovis T2Bo]EDO06622.2 DnaJ domain family protein [Babesia bovis T2Bo]
MEQKPRKRQNAADKSASKQETPTKTTKRGTFNFIRFVKDYSVVIILSICLLFGILLKYFEDKYHYMQNFSEFGEDIYAIMGVSRKATDAEIKAKYRHLNHQWHPDKNPDCIDCKDKFMKLKAAYKILSNPELRKLYDETDGRTINMIPSSTIELTQTNYDELVRSSSDIWVVQLYSDDSPDCQYFSKTWEEAGSKMGQFAKFGRVNSLLNPKAAKKLPIKAQLLPAVMMIYPGGDYDLFPQDVLKSFKQFKNYFLSVYPNAVITCKDYADFKKKAAVDIKRPSMLFHASHLGMATPIPILHLAIKYQWAFDTFWMSPVQSVYTNPEFISDLTHSSTNDNNMIAVTTVIQIKGDSDAGALLYSADKNELIGVTSYSRSELPLLYRNIENLILLTSPPLELTRENFKYLCMGNDRRSEKFCLIVSGNAYKTFDEAKVLTILGKYDISNNIGSVFAIFIEDTEANPPPTMTAEIQLARLPESRTTQTMSDLLGDSVVLLDVSRGKFCAVASPNSKYMCGVEDDTELAWVNDIAEGAYDTLSWHDITKVFGGRFEDRCIKASKQWYNIF